MNCPQPWSSHAAIEYISNSILILQLQFQYMNNIYLQFEFLFCNRLQVGK